MKRSEVINTNIELIVEKAGIKKNILNNPQEIISNDIWTKEREELAKEYISKDTKMISTFWQEKFEKLAAKNWDLFYKRNTINFYKDRHYIHKVFPELSPEKIDENSLVDNKYKILLEVGCGVGNTSLPLLEINPKLYIIAIDFSTKAIELLKKQSGFLPDRCNGYVCDITKDELPKEIENKGGIDFATFMFCLSSIHPLKMKEAVKRVINSLKPGGKIFFRDYGRYDQAQLRFKYGQKLQDNFYVRQDGTRAYFFTIEEIHHLFCNELNMIQEENEYLTRQYANRSNNVVRFRVWIHAKFRKPS